MANAAAMAAGRIYRLEKVRVLFPASFFPQVCPASCLFSFPAAAPVLKLDAEKIPVKKAEFTQGYPVFHEPAGEEKLAMDAVLAGKASVEKLVGQLTVEEVA